MPSRISSERFCCLAVGWVTAIIQLMISILMTLMKPFNPRILERSCPAMSPIMRCANIKIRNNCKYFANGQLGVSGDCGMSGFLL